MRIIEQLVYKITGDNTEFDKSINQSETKVSKFGSVADKMLAGVTVAAIGMVIKKASDMGKEFVNAFAGFESGLAKVSTLFGDVDVNMDRLSNGVLKVSANTGMLTTEINEALYSALSAGVEVTEDMAGALGIVESSSKLAKAGFTDTDTALSATIKTLNAYKLGLDDTDRIQRILMQTQNKGITTVGELGQNLAKVTPTAATFGYSFEQVGASLATMTAQGIRTEVATTYLAQIMTELGKQGTTASESLKKAAQSAGLAETDAKSLTDAGKSLGDILDLMDTYAKDSGKSLVDMFGSVEAGKGALALAGSNLETFNVNLKSMYTNSDLVEEGFATMSETVNGQSAILEANIEALKIKMGKKLLPIASQITSAFVELTGKLLGQDSASKRLTTSTNNLAEATDAYKTITSQLKNPIDNLTEAEKALLEIQQKRAEIKLNQAVIELGKNYADTQRKISDLRNDEKKYQGIIEKSLAVINKYTPEQREEIKNYQHQGRAITDMLLKQRELLTAEEDLEDAQIKLLSTQDKLNEENGNFNASITQIAQSVIDGQIELSTLANINADFAETVRLRAEAMEAEKKATEDAAEAFKAYENMTSEEISTAIKQLSLEEKTLANEKLIELLQKRKIELAGEAAKAADDLAGKEKARNEIIEAGNKAMESAEQYALALGSSYDLNAQKASILETTIKALIDSGLTAEDKAVADLIAQLNALGTTTEDVTAAAYAEIEESRMTDKEKALKAIQEQADAYRKAGVAEADVAKWQSEQIQKYQDEETKTRAAAYKLLESYSLTAKEKAIADIQAQADKFLEAGVSEVDVEKWKTSELGKLQEEQAAKAEEEAERVRKAWEDATFSMLGSVTSIWGSINQVQANQNEEEIQRIEEQNAIAIQAAKDRGASEEEITELEKSLQADLNDTKNKYAQEEAERNKALSILSVILDTAKAIMQIWANPLISPWGKGLWTGLAAGVGAAQLAAINSAPMPSYDVGSIRIPETTTATVHKDEMILTAPQAEQARREGITIAPIKNGGNSVNLVIYLDGKEIARNTLDNINSGAVGTVRARVIK